MKLKKITQATLPLAKELLVSMATDLRELSAQIKVVEATGAASPDGLTTKKAGKKKAAKKAAAAKKVEPVAEKPASKTGKKAAKKAGKKVTEKKVTEKKVTTKAEDGELSTKIKVEYDESGKKLSLNDKVLRIVKDKFADGTTFSPKDVRLGMKLAVNYQVPISQALKTHTEEGVFTKVSRGTYQLAS